MDKANTYAPDQVKKVCAGILEKEGLPPEEACVVADSLVEADLTGVTSHGITRMKMYSQQLRKGGAKANAQVRVIRETPSSALLDGDRALGIVAAHKAMEVAVEKARVTGIAIVNVRNSNHCSALSYFAKMATGEKLMAILCSNSPSTMVPWGSREKYFGTNPFSIAVPTGGAPLVLDMATSVVARGKILLAEKKGTKIPEGWAVDPQGNMTVEPAEALRGSVLPFGGPKGSGIAMMVDIFGGILSGAAFGRGIGNLITHPEQPMNTGHCFIVIDPQLYMPYEEFEQQVDKMAEEIKGLEPAAGFEEVFLPGEIEHNLRCKNLVDGMTIPHAVYSELKALAQELDLPFGL